MTRFEDYINSKVLKRESYELRGALTIFGSTIFPSFSDYFSVGRAEMKKLTAEEKKAQMKAEKKRREEEKRREDELEKVFQGRAKHLDLSDIIPTKGKERVSFVPHPCTSSCVVKWEKSKNSEFRIYNCFYKRIA